MPVENPPPSFGKRFMQALTYTFTGSFFPPWKPLEAQHQEAAGRRYDYPQVFNLRVRPQRDTGITFEVLRGYAEVFDLFRIVLESRKDEIEAFEWSIVAKDEKLRVKGKEVPQEMQARIDAVTAFFRRPATGLTWQQWLRAILEDHFVLDGVCLWPTVKGNKLVACEIIDPATIKILIDSSGRTPEPPLPAFQQVIKGIPAADFRADQLFYFIRNTRSHVVYGKGVLEQILMTVNIALSRERQQYSYFQEGNIPEAIAGVPDTWTPQQINEFQRLFDQYTALEERVGKLKFIPADASKVQMLRHDEALLKNDFDEWLIRIICYAFSVSPLPFIKMMNRATSQSANDTAKEQGLMPLLAFLKTIMDRIITDGMRIDDLEFSWNVTQQVDATAQLAIDTFDLTHGVIDINHLRERRGLEPIEGVEPMIWNTTGPVPLSRYIDGTAPGLNSPASSEPPGGGEDDEGEGEDGEGDNHSANGSSNGHGPPQQKALTIHGLTAKDVIALMTSDHGTLPQSLGKDYNPDEPRDGHGQWTAGGSSLDGFRDKMAEALKTHGGFTFDPRTQKAATEGIAVGAFPSHSGQFDESNFGTEQLKGWMDANAKLLGEGRNYIGGWVDNGKVWLDVVKVYPQSMKDLALAMGRKLNQISVADLGAISRGDMEHAFISTGGTGEASKADAGGFDKVSMKTGDHLPVFLLFPPKTKPETIVNAVKEVWAKQKAARAALKKQEGRPGRDRPFRL